MESALFTSNEMIVCVYHLAISEIQADRHRGVNQAACLAYESSEVGSFKWVPQRNHLIQDAPQAPNICLHSFKVV